jgi:hypothetical protein
MSCTCGKRNQVQSLLHSRMKQPSTFCSVLHPNFCCKTPSQGVVLLEQRTTSRDRLAHMLRVRVSFDGRPAAGHAARAADSKSNALRRPWLKQEEDVNLGMIGAFKSLIRCWYTVRWSCSQVQPMALIGGGAHGWPVESVRVCSAGAAARARVNLWMLSPRAGSLWFLNPKNATPPPLSSSCRRLVCYGNLIGGFGRVGERAAAMSGYRQITPSCFHLGPPPTNHARLDWMINQNSRGVEATCRSTRLGSVTYSSTAKQRLGCRAVTCPSIGQLCCGICAGNKGPSAAEAAAPPPQRPSPHG